MICSTILLFLIECFTSDLDFVESTSLLHPSFFDWRLLCLAAAAAICKHACEGSNGGHDQENINGFLLFARRCNENFLNFHLDFPVNDLGRVLYDGQGERSQSN